MTVQEVNFNVDGPGRMVLPPPDAITARLIREAGGHLGLVGKNHHLQPGLPAGVGRVGERWESEADSSVMAVIGGLRMFPGRIPSGIGRVAGRRLAGAQLVKWEDRHNRSFLLCLEGLGRMAERIGENEERCGARPASTS